MQLSHGELLDLVYIDRIYSRRPTITYNYFEKHTYISTPSQQWPNDGPTYTRATPPPPKHTLLIA
jgi:hypothetical protein